MGITLIVTTSFPRFPGDHAGHFIHSLATELSRTRTVMVLAPDHPGISAEYPTDPGFTVHRFRWFRWNRSVPFVYGNGILPNLKSHPGSILEVPGLLYGLKKSLKTIIEHNNVTKIISNWIVPVSWLVAGITHQTMRHIAVCHGSDFHLLRRLPTPLKQMILKRFHGSEIDFVAVSPGLVKQLTAMLAPMKNSHQVSSPVRWIPMGGLQSVPVRKYKKTRQPVKQILFMGRLIPVKGVDGLLHAMTRVPENYQLHIAGEGSDGAKLQKLAAQLKVNCIFHGFVSGSERNRLILQSDLAVIPSIITAAGQSDGSPTVFLEYLTAGIPVIVSTESGLSGLAISDHNCLEVDNNPARMAEAIQTVIEDKEFAQNLRFNGKKTARQYSWRNIALQFNELLDHDHPNSTKS